MHINQNEQNEIMILRVIKEIHIRGKRKEREKKKM